MDTDIKACKQVHTGGGGRSNLSESELHHSTHLLHLELKCVLIGVMLDNIIVHVDQDPVEMTQVDFKSAQYSNGHGLE